MAEEKPFTISLVELFKKPRPKRAVSAINRIRTRSGKRFHFSEDKVFLSQALNLKIWERGREKIPRRVKLKAVKGEDTLRVYLAEEKVEPKKEKEKEGKKEAKKEEKKTEEEKEKAEETERKKEEKKEMERSAEKAAIKRKVS